MMRYIHAQGIRLTVASRLPAQLCAGQKDSARDRIEKQSNCRRTLQVPKDLHLALCLRIVLSALAQHVGVCHDEVQVSQRKREATLELPSVLKSADSDSPRGSPKKACGTAVEVAFQRPPGCFLMQSSDSLLHLCSTHNDIYRICSLPIDRRGITLRCSRRPENDRVLARALFSLFSFPSKFRVELLAKLL